MGQAVTEAFLCGCAEGAAETRKILRHLLCPAPKEGVKLGWDGTPEARREHDLLLSFSSDITAPHA